MDHFDLVRDVLSELIDIVQDFKDRALYDLLSMNLLKCGVFPPVISFIAQRPFTTADQSKIARILELCACHTKGIVVLKKHLE